MRSESSHPVTESRTLSTLPYRSLWVSILFSLILLHPLPVQAIEPAQQDLPAIVAGLQQRFAAVTTVTANFRQTYRAPGIEQTESGILYMKKPALMHWEYRDPEQKIFIADGRETYLYSPENRQVVVRRFSTHELLNTPLQFLLGHGDIMESFLVSWEGEIQSRIEATYLIRLEPRNPDAEYSDLVLECDEKTFDLRRLVIRERNGNTSEFLLTDLKTNVKINNQKFQFRIPKGVEVIRMEEK